MPSFNLLVANYNDSPEIVWAYEHLNQFIIDLGGKMTLAQCDTEAETIKRAAEADIFLTWKLPITRKVISALPRLRLLMSSGSGYEYIDVDAATDHGVVVTNAGPYNAVDVAEHAIALILACARHLNVYDFALRNNSPSPHPIQTVHRLTGKTVGLIGFGHVGREVCWRAKGLGLTVWAYDPFVPKDVIESAGARSVSRERLLQEADFISPHLRLNTKTRHYLSTNEFRQMKSGAFLINTSRGGIVNEKALIQALKDGSIAGAGLDVLETEPPARDNPLLEMRNVMLTPHLAGSTVESTHDWYREWFRIIENFLEDYWPVNVVNPGVHPKKSLRNKEEIV